MKLPNVKFGFNAASLAFGALGFLAAFVQLFVDISLQISIKWLLFSVWFGLSLVLILFKLVYDLQHEKRPSLPVEVPIRYLPEQRVLLIRRNDNFLDRNLVSCYIKQDEVDTLAGIGYVYRIQEKYIQIKLHGEFLDPDSLSIPSSFLIRLEVRPTVPIEALTPNTGI